MRVQDKAYIVFRPEKPKDASFGAGYKIRHDAFGANFTPSWVETPIAPETLKPLIRINGNLTPVPLHSSDTFQASDFLKTVVVATNNPGSGQNSSGGDESYSPKTVQKLIAQARTSIELRPFAKQALEIIVPAS